MSKKLILLVYYIIILFILNFYKLKNLKVNFLITILKGCYGHKRDFVFFFEKFGFFSEFLQTLRV